MTKDTTYTNLQWKDSYNVTCPFCGYVDTVVMYLNTDEISCGKCDKEFDVEIRVTNIEIVSNKPY